MEEDLEIYCVSIQKHSVKLLNKLGGREGRHDTENEHGMFVPSKSRANS